MPLLIWIEQTGLSVWLRESTSLFAFPGALFLHTLGLGLLAGFSVAVNLCIFDRGRRVPLAPLLQMFPVMWLGFWLCLLSGALLLWAYPVKAVTDPVFYLKLGMVTVGMLHLGWIRSALPAPATALHDRRLRRLAMVSTALWAGSILAGRLLAYTYNYMMSDDLLG
jgi:energy-coupling factor transporter transmembrane protein EcfT